MKTIMERAAQLSKEIEKLNTDVTNHIKDKFSSVKTVSISASLFITVETHCGSELWFGCESRDYMFRESPVNISTTPVNKLEEHFNQVSLSIAQAPEIFEYIKSFCKGES